jgi:hypothetical protein
VVGGQPVLVCNLHFGDHLTPAEATRIALDLLNDIDRARQMREFLDEVMGSDQ